MQNFLSLLFFVVLVLLVVGLVKPQLIKLQSRKRVFLYWLAVSFVILLASGLTSKKSDNPVAVVPNNQPAADLSVAKNQPVIVDKKQQAEQQAKLDKAQKLANVQIVSAKIIKDDIGTPVLHMSFKNKNDKVIDAVTIEAYFFNNFDEPVGKWGSKVSEAFGGVIQDKINPGATYSSAYNLAVYENATKVKNYKVTRVHFADGEDIIAE